MSSVTVPTAETGQKARKQFPWISDEDFALLTALDREGQSDTADAMEALIRSEGEAPEASENVEQILSNRSARASHGPGGGRVRRPQEAGPDA